MSKLKAIVFSKDRASQLQLLFDSIKINADGIFDEINVIYKASNENYQEGYNKLIENYGDWVKFHEEKSFRDDVISLLTTDFEYTTFLVDDIIIYDKICEKEEMLNLIEDDVVCFSMRLGLNCNYSHPANMKYSFNEYTTIDGGYIKFNFRQQQPGDLSYPLSTDGHIFKTSLLKKLVASTNFMNPNTLEGGLQYKLGSIPQNIVSFNTSKLFSAPVNLVNTSIKNRFGLDFYMSELELNDKYLNGEVIDFSRLVFENINGPHKEIKYEFKKEENVT